jgi:mRNA interferase RelE/StbE
MVWNGKPLREINLAYKIIILPAAQKQILDLPGPYQIRIANTIDSLADNPRPKGCKKLRGTDLWRVRSAHLRIIYSITDKELRILVLKVARRQENTYRNLE